MGQRRPALQKLDLFTVTVALPYTDPITQYAGTFSILGGGEGPGGYDPSTQNLLAEVDFNAASDLRVVAVPEPRIAGLLAVGFVILVAVRLGASLTGGTDARQSGPARRF